MPFDYTHKKTNTQSQNTQVGTSYAKKTANSAQTDDKWYKGDTPTSFEIYGRIGQVFQTDPTMATQLYNDFQTLQSTPGSAYYWPYANPTNQAYYNMGNLGYDMSNVDDDWFNTYRGLEGYYQFSGTTNTPSKPGKGATAEQTASYEYFQLGKANDATKSMKSEWEQLQNELAYWALDPYRNYTDDEIIEKVDWKKYPTLKKMMDSVNTPGSTILELNAGTDFSPAAMYGTIWAARNGGGTGNMETNIAMSAMGAGNQYVENPELRAKLDPSMGNTQFAPYSVGSTMEEEGLYFNRASFNQKWLDENIWMLTSGSETDKKMYTNVMKGEAYTQQAEKELAEMLEQIDVMLSFTHDADTILSTLYDGESFKTLYELDTTIGGSQRGVLKDTTRAINYRKEDIEAMVRSRCDALENGELPSEETANTIEAVTGTKPEQNETDTAMEMQQMANLRGAGLSIMLFGTQSEKEAYIASQGGALYSGYDLINSAVLDLAKSKDMIITSCFDMIKVGFGDAKTVADYKTANNRRDTAIYEQAAYVAPELNRLAEKIRNGEELTDDETKLYTELDKRYRELNYIIQSNQEYMDANAQTVMDAKQSGSRVARTIAFGEYLTDEQKTLANYAHSVTENRKNWLKNGDFNLMEDYELDEAYKLLADEMNTNEAIAQKYANPEESIDVFKEAISMLTGGEFDDTIDIYKVGGDEWNSLSEEDQDKASDLKDRAEDMWYTMRKVVAEGKPKRYEDWHENVTRAKFYEGATGKNYFNLSDEEKREVDDILDKAIDTFMVIGRPSENASAANDKLLKIQEVNANRERMAEIESEASNYTDGAYHTPDFSGNPMNDTVAEDDPTAVYVMANGVRDYGILNSKASFMSPEQVETFNKLYNAGEKDKAKEYYKLIEPMLFDQKAAADEKILQSAASGDFGFLVGLATVPMNVAAGMSGGVATIAALLGDENAQSKTSSMYYFTRWTNTIRGTRMDLFDQNLVNLFGEGAKGVGQFFGGVYYSILDNLMAVGVSGGFAGAQNVCQGMVQLLMSSEAAASAMYENLEKGMEPTEAAIRALGTGAIEAFTEKYSLEALLSGDMTTLMNNTKQFLLKNIVAEASEEGASEILDLLMDVVISSYVGHETEIEAEVKKLMAKRPEMTQSQAEAQVWGGWFQNTLTAMAAGGTSGGAMSYGRFLMSAGKMSLSGSKSRSSMDTLITDTLSSGENNELTELAKELQGKQKNGKHISNYDIGRLKFGNDLVNAGTKYRNDVTSLIEAAKGLDKGTDSYKIAQELENALNAGDDISNYDVGRLAYNLFGKSVLGESADDETEAEAEAAPEPVVPETLGDVNTEMGGIQDEQFAKDLTVLFQTAKNGDNQAQASVNVAAVLGNVMDDAKAQAAGIKVVQDIAGGDAHVAAHTVSGLMRAAYDVLNATNTESNMAPETKSSSETSAQIKNMIAYAALTDGAANQALRGISESVANHNAVTAKDVAALVEAVGTDMSGNNSEALDAKIQQTIQDSLVSMEEMRIRASMETDAALKTAEEELNKAKQGLDAATKAQQQVQSEVDAISENLAALANEDMSIPENRALLEQTANKKAGIIKEKNQADQTVANAQKSVEDANKRFESISKAANNTIRQQATANVQQQQAQQAEEQKAQQEEAAKQQAEQDEKTGKAEERKTDAAIEQLLDNEHLEGEERETKRQEYMKMAEQIKLGKINMKGLMNNAEGFIAVQKLANKLGVEIVYSDNLGNARGMYKDGKVYLNNDLIRKGKMTIGQALLEAGLHEFTHDAEKTKYYQKYAEVVQQVLFNGDTAKEQAALDQKKADYREKMGQELDNEGAMKEIVADFARTHLNTKEIVDRLCAEGIGGKIKNTLHNINQALKNYRLTGEERQQAEYLRRAERMFQKTLDEQSRSAVHPEGGQFSVMQIAQATGMRFDDKTRTLYDAKEQVVDGVKNKVTAQMVADMPVGMLIDAGIKGEQNNAAKEMIAGLMNLVARYKDSNLIWEIGATTLNSTFSAIKSNSDPQYKTTVDFGTVCAKTQAIVDVMSQVMLAKIDPKTGLLKEGAKRGLDRKDVMKVYNATHNAKLSVPCPVCYVFSRWMGVPSLLGQMSQYQNDYVVLEKDAKGNLKKDKNGHYIVNKAETQKKVDNYISNAVSEYGSAKAINNKKASLQGKQTKMLKQIDELELKKREQGVSQEERENIQKQIDKLNNDLDIVEKDLGKVSAYNWITQALCKETGKGTGKYVIDDKFVFTPDNILFDLDKTGEFAGYEKNWAYRNTRGAGMGKAIMPYSGETLGDILYGVNSGNNGRRQNSVKNPWLHNDPKTAARQLKNAIDRAKKQNLVGGQRLQSTSDFRPEWGLDYIMSFLELQAAQSKVQMYTKVAEAVDFFASVGADVNLSIMGEGQGWHEDENGNKVLDFSSITGMDYKTAKALKDKYDNVQMILVGMNDTHIRLALADTDIDFVIPWHSSGNSKEVLSGLINAVGEKLKTSVDYTTTQSDMVKGSKKSYYDEHGNKVEYSAPGQQTEQEKALWDARVKLLTKGGNKLTQAEREVLLSNPITRGLYYRFTLEKGQQVTVDGVTYSYDPECSKVKLSGDQAKQIFPYEYWDTTLTKKDADQNGKRFTEYCDAMGIVPRFSQFKDDPGYWKLLIDRPMYDNNGKYRKQQTIDVTKAKIGNLNEQNELENSDLPMSAQAKYAPKDPRNPNYEEYNRREQEARDNAIAAIEDPYNDGSQGQYSVYGDVTLADMEQLIDNENDYMDAVNRGDMDAAAEDVDTYATLKGFIDRAFHGSDAFGFTEFDMEKGKNTIFVAYNKNVAGTYTGNKNVRNVSSANAINYNEFTGDEIAQLLKDKVPQMYGRNVVDSKFVTHEEMGKRVLEYRKTLSDLLKNATFANQQERLGAIEGVARLSGVDESNIRDSQTPAELLQNTFDALLKTGNTLMGVDGTFDKAFSALIAYYGQDANGNRISQQQVKDMLAKGLNSAYGTWSTMKDNIEFTLDDGQTRSVTQDSAITIIRRETGDTGGLYQLYTRPGNQLVVDAEDSNWNHIPFNGTYMNTREIADWAKANGYDSVRINNVYDHGGWGYSKEAGYGDIGIFFNQEDVKSADTVTLDDNGNVIPLDQRFTDSPDIRYSSGGEDTTADMERKLIEAGVFTQEELDAYYAQAGNGRRQFGGKTSQESEDLSDPTKRWLRDHSAYTMDTNKEQIDRASEWVKSMAKEGDPDGYHAAVDAVTADDFDYRSADGQARMITVMSMAASRGDAATELKIADAYNQQGTDIARALQARKLFRLMDPIGRRMTLQQEAARINQELKNQNKDTTVELPETLLKAAEVAQTEEEFAKVQDAALKEIGKQMPANWKDKLRTWRMLSMLANPRTHIRNVAGNAIFKPVVQLKNIIGTGLESMIVKEGGERTKAIRATDEAKAFAKKDVEAMRDVLTGEAKYSPQSKIEQNKKAFGQGKGLLSRTVGKAVQNIADFNSDMLEKEDWIFLNGHYQRALAGYMTANNLTEADMIGDTLQRARSYAVLEAQKATYRDANAVSSWLNKASRRGGVGGFLVDTVLPFKKTPANIMRRGIEYSPFGLLYSLATAKHSVDLYTAWESNGRKGNMPKGAKSLTQALDSIASGITGTMVAGIGALAYALGAVKLGFGGSPDDELDKERGSQEYSIEMFGHSFTIDWAAPICMPFFTGAALYDNIVNGVGEIRDAEDATKILGAVIDSLSGISEPIFNLSMLDGVSSLLKSTSYSNSNQIPIFELVQNIGANYVGSMWPSFFGAVARTVDPTSRQNYVESGDLLRVWKQKIEQVQNKIPYLSMFNIPYRDVYGNTKTDSYFEAFMENFILPGYHTELKEDQVVDELQRIYDEGETGVIPSTANKKIGGVALNDQQYDQYRTTRGQTAKALLDDLVNTDEFIALTGDNTEAQAKLVEDVWTYANAVARHELFPNYKMPTWVSKAYASGDVTSSIIEREEKLAQDAYIETKNNELYTSIDGQDAEAVSTCLEALRQAGKDDKSIRTTVMNHYRDLYKEAFLEGDTDRMNAIEYGMRFLQLGKYKFTGDTFADWRKDALKDKK